MKLTHLSRLIAVATVVGTPAFGGLILTGGNGGIVMGVAPYGGAPNVGGPTFFGNNFTGLNDILTSPGNGTLGGYLTASPVIANNISSVGPGPFAVVDTQTGGGNGSGAFGAGVGVNAGDAMAFALADSGPGGGSASYLISSAVFTMTNAGAAIAAGSTIGDYLGIGGAVPLVGNADVAALDVRISDTAGVFGAGGTTLPVIVLAISRNGAGAGIGNYNIVTVGGVAGGNAGLILDNGVTGAFRALGVSSIVLPAGIPLGDILTVDATLTAYSDPASIDTIFPLDTDLLNLTGPLASNELVGSVALPEPGTWLMLGVGLAAMALLSRSRLLRS